MNSEQTCVLASADGQYQLSFQGAEGDFWQADVEEDVHIELEAPVSPEEKRARAREAREIEREKREREKYERQKAKEEDDEKNTVEIVDVFIKPVINALDFWFNVLKYLVLAIIIVSVLGAVGSFIIELGRKMVGL